MRTVRFANDEAVRMANNLGLNPQSQYWYHSSQDRRDGSTTHEFWSREEGGGSASLVLPTSEDWAVVAVLTFVNDH